MTAAAGVYGQPHHSHFQRIVAFEIAFVQRNTSHFQYITQHHNHSHNLMCEKYNKYVSNDRYFI